MFKLINIYCVLISKIKFSGCFLDSVYLKFTSRSRFEPGYAHDSVSSGHVP
jgi:hypothetical protein